MARGKRMKSQLIVWTSTRRFCTLPGTPRRTSSLSQLPTTSFCSKRITNIHIYNITYFILSSNLLSQPQVSPSSLPLTRAGSNFFPFSSEDVITGSFSRQWRGGVRINLTYSHNIGGFLKCHSSDDSTETEDQSISCFSLYS